MRHRGCAILLARSQLWGKFWTKHADEMNFNYAQAKCDLEIYKNGWQMDTLQRCVLCVGASELTWIPRRQHMDQVSYAVRRPGALIPAEQLILSEGKLRVVFNDRLSLHKSGPLWKKERKKAAFWVTSGSIVCNPEGPLKLQKKHPVTGNVPEGCCLANVLLKVKWND